jgi:glycosyltransferase involved in cell wall biosynthesis
LARVPIIVNTVHGTYVTPMDSWLRRVAIYLLEGLAARFSDAELYQSAEDLELMVRLHVCPKRKALLLGNGIDLNRFSPARRNMLRTDSRAQLGITETDIVVGTVGRLVAEKGYPELFEANRLLRGLVRILVVGDHDPDKPDALDPEVVRAAQDQGVLFAGFRQDIDSLYAAMDIFGLPSHREGIPRSLMEASAMGLPVVATDIRGCREVVEAHRTGVFVPVSDAPSLAAALRSLAEDPLTRERMGNAGRQKAVRDFDERRVIETVLSTYDRLAGDQRKLGRRDRSRGLSRRRWPSPSAVRARQPSTTPEEAQ